MRKSNSRDTTREGLGSNPPRYASEALVPPEPIAERCASPHFVEQEVQRELLAEPSLHFASLVVRRIDDGVCLQGVLEADDKTCDVSRIAQRVAGVRHVLNRLVIAPRRDLPAKG